MKKLLKVDAYFGKFDGKRNLEYRAVDDTPEERKYIVEDYVNSDDDAYEKEDFIAGKVDNFEIYRYGVDWDEPNSYEISLETFDKAMDDLKKDFDEKVEKLKKEFNVE